MLFKQKIVGMGAGGHARSLVDALHSTGRYRVVAIGDDNPELVGGDLLGIPVLDSHRLEGLARCAFVGVGGIKDSGPRIDAFRRLRDSGFVLPPIVHAEASVSPFAQIGQGAQILAGAVVNAGALISQGAIINSGALVEHDCFVGSHTHVAPGAVFGGGVTIGAGCHIGMCAVVLQGVHVGSSAFIAAGAVVTRDVAPGEWVCGVPAHKMRAA